MKHKETPVLYSLYEVLASILSNVGPRRDEIANRQNFIQGLRRRGGWGLLSNGGHLGGGRGGRLPPNTLEDNGLLF